MVNKYYALILLLNASNGDRIISSLVKQGFVVSKPSNTIPCITSNSDWPVASVALSIITTVDIENMEFVIAKIMDDMNMKYFSIAVIKGAVIWRNTNIRMSAMQKQRAEKLQKASHLKLVPSPNAKKPSDTITE